jgi:ketosteroid isomerase-like protein
MTEQENIQKLQDLYAAFGRGDINGILENVTDDVTWGTESVATEIPWYRLRTGRSGVADFFATLDREVEFEVFDPQFFAGTGNEVLVYVEISYRFRKNGRRASVQSIHRHTLKDGIVTRFRAVEDTAAVREAWRD